MKTKTLLILGSSAPGALETYYRQGFEKSGVKVDTFGTADQYYAQLGESLFNRVRNRINRNTFYPAINEGLIRFMNKKRYDVILVFKGMELFPETVQLLKSHAAVTANYNADHPFTFYAPGSGNRHVVNSIQHYDVHFSYAKKIVQQLQTKFGKEAHCIPFGFNEAVPVQSPDAASPHADRILFIGTYDRERACYLNHLKSGLLDIYGEDKWRSRNLFRPFVRHAYRNSSLFGSDYAKAITSSMGILNLIRMQNMLEDSHNMRTFEVPGYGGLLVSQRTGEQCEYFEENKEAVFFSSQAELEDKLAYLSTHPAAVLAMKQAARYRSAQAGYSYGNRSKQLLACLEPHL